jgi:hypothetical protein
MAGYDAGVDAGVRRRDVNPLEISQFPSCRRCGEGDLVPLSDFGGQGAAVQFKAWVCTNPNCGFNLKIRNGEVSMNEPVTDVSSAPVPQPASHASFRSVR